MDNRTLGEKIRGLRVENGLSIRKLAERARISHSFLRDIECGHRNPTEPVLARVAAELDVKVTDLRDIDIRLLLSELKRLLKSEPAWAAAMKRLTDAAGDGTVTPAALLKKIGKGK